MVQRRIALTIYQPARPGVPAFATLAAFEAASRSVLISVYPVLMYRALGDAKLVSQVYLAIGLASLGVALLVPVLNRLVPRRWLYTSAGLLMIAGNAIGLLGPAGAIPLAVLTNAVALVVLTVCFNAYIMDYIDRTSLGRNETMRLLYSGVPWTVGPFLGVWLMNRAPAAPFILSSLAVVVLLAIFWWLRLGDGKVIVRARKPAANPLAHLPRFFAQPSLVAGWLFSVIRSLGWAIYLIYVPIFAIEAGLGDQAGGASMSISNAFLFIAPLFLRYLQATSVRTIIITGFLGSGTAFIAATLLAGTPLATLVALVVGTTCLVMLDVSGGLPFLMAVKPSERTEMASVFSTYRDVSSVLSPAFAWAVLLVAPVSVVFAATGAALLACAGIARRVHPRLGRRRLAGPAR